MKQPVVFLWIFLVIGASGCGSRISEGMKTPDTNPVTANEESQVMSFKLSSPAFENEGDIPSQYTCQGAEISPPLGWENPPGGTTSFALVAEDLIKRIIITHWVAYNIPGTCRELPEAIPVQKVLDDGTCQGKNWRRQNGYMGPCPIGGRHRYRFTIFALDTVLAANPGMNKKMLLKSIEGHILGSASLVGCYAKK